MAPEITPETATSGDEGSTPWVPLAFTRDLTADPTRVTVHDRGFVLFRDRQGAWSCLLDRCPHRVARLSDGVVRGGRLECLYHGWQFAGDGRCTSIPQLLDSLPIPGRAHVPDFPLRQAQGMLWLAPESSGDADAAAIPIVPDLERPGCRSIDFAIDLPYEQSFLIENVIDIAHIHVAHHGVRGGGHRDLAAPIRFEPSAVTAGGFSASFRSVGLDGEGDAPAMRGARVDFQAPHLVHYRSLYEDPDLCSGLALYSLPLGRDRCRLLYRAYSNFWRLRDRLRPRWLEHWTQCTILEQDMDVVVGQVEEIVGSGRPPRELWLPLKTSDALVIAYRRWLDRHAAEGSYRVGFDRVDAAGSPPGRGPAETYDRFRMHTRLCGSCSRAHRALVAARTPLGWSAVALLAVAAAAGSPIAGPAAGLAVAAAAGRVAVDRLAARFR